MIRNLSNEQLAIVASYLPSTSAACFAVALSSPSSSGELSGVFGDELDFTNIPELSDDVLRDVLLSIDAKNELKILRLEGCSQIVGHGLEPVSESTVLERLDLPRVGNGLSIDIIIPLIVSIRNRYWELLRNLSFPEEWASRDTRNDQALYEELERINQYLPEESDDRFCFECYYFDDCRRCDNCSMTMCLNCGDFECCQGCDSCYCSTCAELDFVNAAAHCGAQNCCNNFCSACAPEYTACVKCDKCVEFHQIAPKLLVKNEEKAAEIVEMRNNIDALTNENEQLRREIDELRKRKRDD